MDVETVDHFGKQYSSASFSVVQVLDICFSGVPLASDTCSVIQSKSTVVAA